LTDAIEASTAAHPITVIETPSGFGKTTALAEYASARAGSTTWLTLTHHDQDPSQLLRGILTALLVVYPRDAALRRSTTLLSADSAPTREAVQLILDAAHSIGRPTLLVVDDVHHTSKSAISEVVIPLAQHSQGLIRFVLAGAHSVTPWLTRSIANGDAHRLTSIQFAFTREEVREVVRVHRPAVETTDLAEEVWKETNGWPVAVQLAVRASSAGSSSADLHPSAVREVLTDYIREEVLPRLPSDLREFVLDATTCDRLNPALAARLTGSEDGTAQLEECHRLGLFLDRFSHAGSETVYQWHSTFALHCRIIARHNDPDAYQIRHRVAADWLGPRFPAEAVVHALEAEDAAGALSILRDNWLQMITGGQAGVLSASCLRIPEPWLDSPDLLFMRACCLDVSGDRHGARSLLTRARAMVSRNPEPADESTLAIEAFASLFLAHEQGALRIAADRAEQILDSPALGSGQHLYGTFLLGWTEMRLRTNPDRAIRLLTTAAESARQAGLGVLAGRASANLGFALAFGGQFAVREAMLRDFPAREPSAIGEWDHYDGGIEAVAAMYAAYWCADLELVLDLCREVDRGGGHPSSYAALARVHFAFAAAAVREPEVTSEAEEMLLRVSDVERHGVPWPAYKMIAQALLAFARGDHEGARIAAEPLMDYEAIPVTLVLLAELYRRLGDLDLAVHSLHRLDQRGSVSYVRASSLFTSAAIAWMRGDRAAAHELLEQGLDLAAPESIVRPFTDLDDCGLELLTSHAVWGTTHEGFLAARIGGHAGLSRHDVLASPLSAREREIFGYLCTTMTAEEIAETLFLSVNTVRTHQRSIYRKLGVRSRRDAIRLKP